MKTLIFLFCVIAFTSANFTPDWYDCGNTTATNVFTPTNVTVQKDPTNETKTLITYCGNVNSHNTSATIIRKLEVQQIDDPWYWVYDEKVFKVVPSGSDICWNYTETYSNYQDVLVWTTAFNVLGDQIACVNMTLSWTDKNPKNKFLSRSELMF